MLRFMPAVLALALAGLILTTSCVKRQYVKLPAGCEFPETHDGAALYVVGIGVATDAPKGVATYVRQHESGRACVFTVATDDCTLWRIEAADCEN